VVSSARKSASTAPKGDKRTRFTQRVTGSSADTGKPGGAKNIEPGRPDTQASGKESEGKQTDSKQPEAKQPDAKQPDAEQPESEQADDDQNQGGRHDSAQSDTTKGESKGQALDD
jgi:hypothetical protein